MSVEIINTETRLTNKLLAGTSLEQFQKQSDKEAGFEITENFQRFSQRDDVFSRVWWDKDITVKNFQDFYDSMWSEAVLKRGDGFAQKDCALRNAAWSTAYQFAERNLEEKGIREGFLDPFEPYRPVAKNKLEITDPSAMSVEIKKVAKFFGADLAGIAAYDPRWVYTYRTDSKTREEKPNPLPEDLTSVIVVGHEMDINLVSTYPSALAGASVGNGYSKETATAQQLAQYIRLLGYEAIASMNDTSLVIPYAIKAGLGEYGRNQMVLTPEFGPRQRFSKIFTNMPLSHDKPISFGVKKTCDTCTRCAEACPPKALPFGEPEEGGPNKSSIKGIVKWTANCEKCFSYWVKMKTDCAICMRVCPYNRDNRLFLNRIMSWMLSNSLRKIALKIDDKLGRAKRLKPSTWWTKMTSH